MGNTQKTNRIKIEKRIEQVEECLRMMDDTLKVITNKLGCSQESFFYTHFHCELNNLVMKFHNSYLILIQKLMFFTRIRKNHLPISWKDLPKSQSSLKQIDNNKNHLWTTKYRRFNAFLLKIVAMISLRPRYLSKCYFPEGFRVDTKSMTFLPNHTFNSLNSKISRLVYTSPATIPNYYSSTGHGMVLRMDEKRTNRF